MRDDRVYLRHIREASRRIEAHTAWGHEEFMVSDLLQDAVLRNLQTMAEASMRLSPSVTLTEPGIDWRAIAGFRNILVHNYLGIDLEQVWAITQREVPELQRAAARRLAALDA
ncbi:MAG: HepT-like ribonuclease domain-containing protein [Gemmatimonadota bacterium]|nr:HepT-like ribonuclease domain-containing protein [Gemmatimonadota bacterium]